MSLISIEVAKLSLVLYVAVFSCLKTLCQLVTFLITVKTGDITQVFASHTGNIGSMETGS